MRQSRGKRVALNQALINHWDGVRTCWAIITDPETDEIIVEIPLYDLMMRDDMVILELELRPKRRGES